MLCADSISECFSCANENGGRERVDRERARHPQRLRLLFAGRDPSLANYTLLFALFGDFRARLVEYGLDAKLSRPFATLVGASERARKVRQNAPYQRVKRPR